jgi:translation initiation factor 3 subunit E
MYRHLVFPVLEFLQERQLFSESEILEAKIRLLSGTGHVRGSLPKGNGG